ncbi:Sec-independent protein translocase protein TatB [Nocardia sp. NBC_01503]|uniref:Sec-independent protein translocase protein TatB n=1 Tax=Nocardia sp. NBC_01503 TaxID=2975997 RepID=UPI002E7C3F30|nr:Sec-independent protein translocase protein TatB [Nocardia sp. NBC_01503]WTL35826.1 Sec-independent protein translocase protein TatB [Nocardia sp. NBC_01503]
MFSNISWGELLILLVAALVILGPERLPGAVRWTTQSLRQVRDYASGATQQLKDELGPEFDEIRKPLEQLNELRGMNPKSLVTKHLLNGDDSFLTGSFDKPVTSASSGFEDLSMPKPQKPLERNERPPVDPDAT